MVDLGVEQHFVLGRLVVQHGWNRRVLDKAVGMHVAQEFSGSDESNMQPDLNDSMTLCML